MLFIIVTNDETFLCKSLCLLLSLFGSFGRSQDMLSTSVELGNRNQKELIGL